MAARHDDLDYFANLPALPLNVHQHILASKFHPDGLQVDAQDFPEVKFRCPVCGSGTRRTTAKDHPFWSGTPFYGCERFPECSSITTVNGVTVGPQSAEMDAENGAKLAKAVRAGHSEMPDGDLPF